MRFVRRPPFFPPGSFLCVVQRLGGRRILFGFMAIAWFLIFLSVIAAPASAAETKTFTWLVPTERVDDTPMPGSELTRYELGCESTATADPAVYSEWPVTDPLIATRIESFPPGRWFCVLRVYAVGLDGDVASDWSNQVFFSILISPPKAPAGLNVS